MKASELIYSVPRRVRRDESEAKRKGRRAERRARIEFKRAFVTGRAV